MKRFGGFVWVVLFQWICVVDIVAESAPIHIGMEDGLAFPQLVDMKAGLVFPLKLSGWLCLDVHRYDDPELGYSLRYKKDEWNKIDIYVYDLGHSEISNGTDSEKVKKEARSVSRIINQLEQDDSYAGVRKLGKTIAPLSGRIRFIKEAYQYTELQHKSAGDSGQRLSESYITGYNNHFVKVRFTYDVKQRAVAKKVAKDLVQGLIGIMQSDHDQKTMALAAIKVFGSDPLSDAGRLAMQGLIEYAVETEDFTISIPDGIFPWIDKEKKVENAGLLFAGYFVGVMSYIIPRGLESGGEVEGFSEMIEIYRKLRDEEAIQKIPELEEWLTVEDTRALFRTLVDKS